MTRPRRWLVLALTSLLSLTSLSALADGVADEAEVNFRLGAERYQQGDYQTALAYFLTSNRLAPNRRVRFNVARTFQRLSQFPEAHRWCQEALIGETDQGVRTQLEATLRAIEHEVAVVELSTSPPGATVFIDRRDLGSVATTPSRIALSEGEHRLILQLAGYEDATSEPIALARGDVLPLAVSLRRIVGKVEVVAEGKTEVRIDRDDGPPACVAPCQLELAPGFYLLHFAREGFRVPSQQVQVSAAQSTRVRVEASPLTGALLVTSDESDALVEVDGVAMGFTPMVARNVPAGRRRVRVSLRGFVPLEQVVEVQAGAQSELRDLSLVPSREVTAASRFTQSIDDAPASVSVVSAHELTAFRYPTIYDALRGQRGVALSYDGVYSGLSIRGLGQPGDYGNRVLVLSDGATLNDNILWQSYVGYDGRVDLGDVDRIELVRGPGSVLYGTGAMSGVVNLVPKALPQRATGEARISVSDTRTARARAQAGVPLGRRAALSLSVAGAHGDGERVRLMTAPTPTSVRGYNRFDAATGNARLEYRALTLQAFVTTRKQDIPNGAYGALVGRDGNTLRDSRGLLEARFDPVLGPKLRLFTRIFTNLYNYEAKQVYAGESPASVTRIDESYRGAWSGAEARIVASLTPSLRLSAGTELQASTLASLDGSSSEGGVKQRYLHANEPYLIYAAYGLVEWQLVRALSVSAGARADAWSTFGATVNPRLALIVRPTARDVIKLMGGRAFRAPSIYQLRYSDGGTTQEPSDYAGNKLRPELLWSGELEYTHHFDDAWSLLGSAHVQYAEDFIEQALTDPRDPRSAVYYRNGGSSVYTAGADLELRRELRAGWMVAANYGYLAARYLRRGRAGGDAQVPNVPSHYGSARSVVALGSGTQLALRTSVEAPRRVGIETRARTSTAVLTDLVFSGEAARAGLDYAVGLYNMFDWRFALPTDPTFVTRTMPQPGRTLLVSLGLRI